MKFVFENRDSDSPLVETIWRTQSVGSGSFISPATSNMEMVITRQQDAMCFTVRGPETIASPAPIPENAEFVGILFKLGTFMPVLPASQLVDGGIDLPEAAGHRFWLHGATWQFPGFDNADTFVDQLMRQGLLAHEPVVEATLQGQPTGLSARSVQRRFRRITGLTHGTIHQIERARRAMVLLQQGVSILDTVEQAGYYDQPHLTRSLRRLIGQTPAQLTDN
jgi:AraC-like DNA-binding protein